jgi:hypothetical protein
MVNSPCQSCLACALLELGLILNFRDSIDPEDFAKQAETNSVTSVMSRYFNNTLDPQTVDQVAGRMAAVIKVTTQITITCGFPMLKLVRTCKQWLWEQVSF